MKNKEFHGEGGKENKAVVGTEKEMADSGFEKLIDNLNNSLSEIEKQYELIVKEKNKDDIDCRKIKSRFLALQGYGRGLALKALSVLAFAGIANKSLANDNFCGVNKNYNKTEIALSDKDNLKNKAEEYREDYGVFMSCNLALENPNEYQEKQILSLQNKIIKEVAGKKFESLFDLVSFVNESIDDNFSAHRNPSIFLKDAFSDSPESSAKGSFDCDSRSIMIISVLEKIGELSGQIDLCLLEGHALLYLKEDKSFFETTNNKEVELSEAENLQITKINSYDKYYAYLLGNEALSRASRADANVFSGAKVDESQMNLASKEMNGALDIDPENINNLLNLLKIYQKIPKKNLDKSKVTRTVDMLQRSLLNRYYKINKDSRGDGDTFFLGIQELENDKNEPDSLEDIGELNGLTIKALENSDYLMKKFSDLAEDLFYKFNDYSGASSLFKSLVEAQKNKDLNMGNENSLEYNIYNVMLNNCHFKSKKFGEYLKNNMEVDLYKLLRSNDGNNISDFVFGIYNESRNKRTVAEIISGKTIIDENNIDNFCKDFKGDELLGPFIIGREGWNASFIDEVEALRDWDGFKKLESLFAKWRENNTVDNSSN